MDADCCFFFKALIFPLQMLLENNSLPADFSVLPVGTLTVYIATPFKIEIQLCNCLSSDLAASPSSRRFAFYT